MRIYVEVAYIHAIILSKEIRISLSFSKENTLAL
jgi:hypothetical protein